ncbi:uncharacterized protein HMPREF1541_04082 [Cyphellophora europaea CBS 101466]|uniref:Uncharacterized protein n=1 Tax=Cyphellophora europaea (strain CBS 101466) TaxID=1220924 RepID=W2S078_CYPE1|nr:uncharacterized protein HMPREF1541_04082 [Cyphellophora europaea CBS 101466]ETN42141.1 hypothetical protein HMPREF1541_04082 [Cyphellophora europaea CBS 101466]
MPAPLMDAVGSFTHLTDNIPIWLTQLESLSKYTKEKNKEFVAEYERLVKSSKPKRVKSPSVCSIQSDNKSIRLPEVEPSKPSGLETAPDSAVDPLEAGTKHIYAAQVQRKRKPTASLRSGASGPQKFRIKHQVVIYYDAHIQQEFDAMVKAVGIARNNLRKGKNSLTANRGFQLPNLSKRYEGLTSPSLENIRSLSKYRSSSMSPSGSKLNLRTSAQPQDPDEAAFMNSDKVLETVQSLYETAAHQFLRDGDCQKELDTATTRLTELLRTAKSTAETLKAKQLQQQADDPSISANVSRNPSLSDQGCPSLLSDKSSMEPLNLPSVPVKGQLSALTQTLDDMREKGVVSAPPATSVPAPQGVMAIEVDDGSDAGSFDDIDISQFRSNRLRMRA